MCRCTKNPVAAAHVKAGCVQVSLLELNVRILLSYLIAAGKEESICPPPEGVRKKTFLHDNGQERYFKRLELPCTHKLFVYHSLKPSNKADWVGEEKRCTVR